MKLILTSAVIAVYTAAIFVAANQIEEDCRRNGVFWDHENPNGVRLCECNSGGVISQCYNRTEFVNYTNPLIVNLTRSACDWQFRMNDCPVSDWIPSHSCPMCACNDKGNTTWKEIDNGWARECYYCACDKMHAFNKNTGDWDEVNATECRWHDMLFGNDTCPGNNLCEATGANSWERFVEANAVIQHQQWFYNYTTNEMNTACQLQQCGAAGGQFVNVTFADVQSNSNVTAGVLGNNQNAWALSACKNNVSDWQYYCGGGASFSCKCPAGTARGDNATFHVENLADRYEWLKGTGIAYESCMKCECGAPQWGDGPDEFVCYEAGTDVAPLQHCPPTLQCDNYYGSGNGQSGEQWCVKSDVCQKTKQAEVFGRNMFTGPLNVANTPQRGGCGDPMICGLIGSGNCRTAPIDVHFNRYDPVTDSAITVHLVHNDTVRCCSSAEGCRKADEFGVCPNHKVWAEMENFKYRCLFGTGTVPMIEHLGRLEHEATVRGEESGFELIFEVEQCSNRHVVHFMNTISKCYCKYLSLAHRELDGNADAQTSVEKEFIQFQQNFAVMMSDAGCTFNPTCDFTTGVLTGRVRTSQVTFDLQMNATVTNQTHFAVVMANRLGIKNWKQLTIVQTNNGTRRRLTEGVVYAITINAQSDAEAAKYKDEVNAGAVGVGSATVAVAENKDENIDGDLQELPEGEPTISPSESPVVSPSPPPSKPVTSDSIGISVGIHRAMALVFVSLFANILIV